MSREFSPKTFISALGIPTNDLEITDTDAHVSEALAFGATGFSNGLFVVENDLDQTAPVIIQGRHPDTADWQTVVGATSVGAGLNSVIPVTAPWGELRVSITCALAPTTGSVKVVFVRVRGSAPGSGAGTIDVVVTSFLDILATGQTAMADAFPVVIASDQSDIDAIITTILGIAAAGQGAMAASIPVVIASDQSAVEINIADLLGIIALGQTAMAGAIPVAVASDQSDVPVAVDGASPSQSPTVDHTDAYTAGDNVGSSVAISGRSVSTNQ